MNAVQKKSDYQVPQMEVIDVELQKILCETNTEPIDPGTGYEW